MCVRILLVIGQHTRYRVHNIFFGSCGYRAIALNNYFLVQDLVHTDKLQIAIILLSNHQSSIKIIVTERHQNAIKS